jgi:hypothetical protein
MAKLSQHPFYSSSLGEAVTAAVHIALFMVKLPLEHFLQLAKLLQWHLYSW